MTRIFQSLIQSDLGGTDKNFEAVVLEGGDLWHWWRDNSEPGRPWKRGQRIVGAQAAYPASIIRSDFGDGSHGNFEVVVPLNGQGGTIELWHFWHDNSDVHKPWAMGQRITEPGRHVIGPASIIQSDFGDGQHGNFEVVVPVRADDGRWELRHYWHDNSDVNKPWSIGQRINNPTHEVLGGGCIIQGDFAGGGHGNFEIAAWVRLPDGRSVIQHYWHDNSDVTLPWREGQVIGENARGPAVIIQSSFGFPPHGNFEVVAPIGQPSGHVYLQHFWHDNSDVNLPWRFGQAISEIVSANGAGCIMQSSYGSGQTGNFEVLVDECSQSLVAYWHPNWDVNLPWIRHSILLGEPPAREIRDTVRICQLTGEFDRTDWNGVGQPAFAFNKTETRYGVRGTDLGVSFEHRGRLYFLFGDTWRVGESRSSHFDWDSIAFCTDTDIAGGLHLTFYKQPPIVAGISQGAFDVPLDGLSYGGDMFVFFSTDHQSVGDAELMGRSVLAMSENDGYDFKPLLTFSRSKFINVSIERGQLDRETAKAIGWRAGIEVLWIWGSGRYRGSPAYLAVADLERLISIAKRNVDERAPEQVFTEGGPIRYYAGNKEQPRWSWRELDAVPLFCAGDIGELSGRFNSIFGVYFLTYNTGNPRGITLRHAVHPWGPWSQPTLIFDPGWKANPNDPISAGYGKFMHIPWNVAKVDNVQDDAFLGGRRDNEWGGEYGPYQIPSFSVGQPDKYCDLHYVMSTWNPYEVMLMKTRINKQDL